MIQFQFATSEATRKILKKHAKRTALPVSPSLSSRFSLPVIYAGSSDVSTSLVPFTPTSGTSFSLMLVQAMGETLLPVIPHIDDYACVICTSIAFKPIRLQCGHLFCVRSASVLHFMFSCANHFTPQVSSEDAEARSRGLSHVPGSYGSFG